MNQDECPKDFLEYEIFHLIDLTHKYSDFFLPLLLRAEKK
jgi:hypothetical protein